MKNKDVAFLGACAVGIALALSGSPVATFFVVVGSALCIYGG